MMFRMSLKRPTPAFTFTSAAQPRFLPKNIALRNISSHPASSNAGRVVTNALKTSDPAFEGHPESPVARMSQAAAAAAVLLSGLALISPGPALAAEGDSNPLRSVLRAPAEFLRSRQQSNGGAFILGPIRSSASRLQAAAAELPGGNYASALKSVRAASMDCVVFDFDSSQRTRTQDLSTAPSTGQEYKLGDPCKLRLVVKSATTLTQDKELVTATENKMQSLIRQIQLLDDMLDRAQEGDGHAAQAAPMQLREAINANIEFETAVKQCLGV